MHRFPWLRLVRPPLAICAAVVAVRICILRHHVHVSLADPRTYASPFQHKCGLLMIGCVLWAVFEVAMPRHAGLILRLRGPAAALALPARTGKDAGC